MIFDLEDEGNERSSAEDVRLPLNEPPVAPVRPTRARAAGPGLPSSLSTLRPSSLPAPSHVRPTRHFAPSNDVVSQSLSPSREFVKRVTLPQPDSDDSSELDNQEAEIMKLVAANTPSHRGAWKKDSKAWQMFVNRKGGLAGRVQIREEHEDDTPAEDEESDADSGSSDAQKGRYILLWRWKSITDQYVLLNRVGPLRVAQRRSLVTISNARACTGPAQGDCSQPRLLPAQVRTRKTGGGLGAHTRDPEKHVFCCLAQSHVRRTGPHPRHGSRCA